MEGSYSVFIKILENYVNQGSFIDLGEEVNWGEICLLGDIHSVSGIIYEVITRLKIKTPQRAKEHLEKVFFKCVNYSLNLETQTKKILNVLEREKIVHFITKGYVLREYYPQKELRTMGDVDIYIEEKDIERAKKVLSENGYELKSVYFSELTYEKDGARFEVHDNLLYESLGNGFNYGTYFKGKCEKVGKEKEKYTYELDKNDHLIYLISHIGKHFYSEGCGIRMILDIAIYLKRFKDELNFDYIFNEFEKIGLKKFAENIFYLCKVWFKSEINFKEMDKELYVEVKKYVLEAGTFGFFERSAGAKVQRGLYEEKVKGGVFKLIFPDEEKMRYICPWFREKKSYLLPIAYVVRIFGSLFNKGFEPIKKLFDITTKKGEGKKQYRLIKELGLYSNGRNV